MNKGSKNTKKLACLLLGLLLVQSTATAQGASLRAYADSTDSSVTQQAGLTIGLESIAADGSTGSFVAATFSNERTDLVKIAKAGVLVNGEKLNYNENAYYISYANVGDCVVSGQTISFYTSSLSQGSNTVTFTNPDGEDVSVTLKMTKTEAQNWWEQSSYTVEVIDNDTTGNDDPQTGSESNNDENDNLIIGIESINTDGSTGSFVVAAFSNERADLVKIAQAGVLVNGEKLNYNENAYYINYANVGDCVVSGQTISFYTSSLSQGSNTVTFTNPDGEDVTVTLKMTKTEAQNWWEQSSYTVEVIDNDTSTDTDSPTDNDPQTDSDTDNQNDPENLPDEPQKSSLYVRIVGGFDHKIVGQEDDVDAVSSATTGSSSYISSSSTAHVEYALVDENTALADVSEDAWQKPDYFTNGNILQVNGASSKIVIEPDGSGMTGEINPFSGDLFLRGVPEKAGTYKVYVYLDTDKGAAVSNTVNFKVYSGEEKLIDQLTYENCVQTADGKYMFDNEPWYITEFGGENETVTVPKDIKAWYGSHAALPEVNYGELGRTISLTNGEEPTQTLIIPEGCNLTMVNMRIHSGVRVIVENGAKLTLRQTTAEGIIEVRDGGTFSMDYNDYGSGEWLHGSSINGQLQMKDGSTLENARIVSHTNYSARDDENRRNFAPVVTTEGNVSIKGDVYILGDEAPSGETGQPALKVSGTLNVPEGSVLAVYGGGNSMLTADGGDAVVLDNGTITGEGSLIAVGGYGMNITADKSKGNGGAAVSGNGAIETANAYLEGGSSYQNPAKPISGDISVSDITNRKLVNGASEQGETYWKGTGDANGIVPDTAKVLALIPQNAPAAAAIGKTAVTVDVEWSDGADKHSDDSVTVTLKTRDGKTVKSAEVTAADDWSASFEDLDGTVSYIVECGVDNCTASVKKSENENSVWTKSERGNVNEGSVCLVTYEENGKTYILGADGGTLGKAEWNGEAPKDIPDNFKWVPEKASGDRGWYLMNQSGEGNTYLSMKQSGFEASPVMYERSSYDYYYALVLDNDGSIWNKDIGMNFLVENGVLTTSSSDFTEFDLYEQTASQTESFIVTVTPDKTAEDTTTETDTEENTTPETDIDTKENTTPETDTDTEENTTPESNTDSDKDKKSDEGASTEEDKKSDDSTSSEEDKKSDDGTSTKDDKKSDDGTSTKDGKKSDNGTSTKDDKKSDESASTEDDKKSDDGASTEDDKKSNESASTEDDKKSDDGASTEEDKKSDESASSEEDKKSDDGASTEDDKKSDNGASTEEDKKSDESASSEEDKKSDDGASTEDDKKSDDSTSSEEDKKSDDGASTKDDKKSDDGTSTKDDKKSDDDTSTEEDKATEDEAPLGKYGDIDGDGEITANDALMLLRATVGMADLTTEQITFADVDSDSDISANDALAVLRNSVGMEDDNNVGKLFNK